MGQVLVWRSAIDGFEGADEMKLGITSLVGNIARVDGLGKIVVNEQLRLHDPSIEVEFWQTLCGHNQSIGSRNPASSAYFAAVEQCILSHLIWAMLAVAFAAPLLCIRLYIETFSYV